MNTTVRCTGWDSPLSTCTPDGHLQVWRYQMLYNTIMTSWWSAQQSGAQVDTVLSQPVHRTTIYRVWRYQMLYNTILTSWRWTQQSSAQVETDLSQRVHRTATYRCDDTRCCITQLWPPDDQHNSPVHRLRQSSLNLCTGRPPTGVTIPDAI